MDMKNYIRIAATAAALLLAFLLGNKTTSRKEKTVTKTVVAVVHDTVNTFNPVYLTSTYVGFIDVPVTELEVKEIHDTTYVSLPLERKVYQDSTYRAVVSGYRPSLDSLQIYRKTEYITTTNTQTIYKRHRFSVGITAGASAVWHPECGVVVGPGATVGLQYHF